MPTFSYKALSSKGESVSGVLTAENYQVALRNLEEQALYPVRVQEGVVAGKSLTGRKKKVKLSHLTIYYSQLADLLRAGVPMLRALDVMSKQTANPVLAEVLRDVKEEVAGGQTLADAMDRHRSAFSELHVSMVRAGERGGFLEEVLERIAGFAERQDELRNKLIGAIIYPCILCFVATLVITFLMGFVVPKLREYLRPENYNILTHFVFGACDVLVNYYPLIIGTIATAVVGTWMYLRTQAGQRWFAKFKLKAPIFGKVFTLVTVCRFCRILGTMLHNGVPILQSLKISKDSAGNQILAEEIEKASESVRKGDAVSQPLAVCGLFPLDVINMIEVAEESNNLENVLIQIADTNERRTARQIDLAVRILEPILLLMMAVVVVVIALALLLPILTMSAGALG